VTLRFAVSLLSLRPGRVGGAETYLRELLRRIGPAAAAAGDEVVAVLHPEAAQGLEAPGVERILVPRGDRALVAARIAEAFTPWRDVAVERAFAAARADATLFPQQSVYPARVAGPVVLTVLDVQHIDHPEWFGRFDTRFRAAVYPRSLARADRVLAISGFTGATLRERCGVEPGRIEVVHLGAAQPPPAPQGGWPTLPEAPRPYLYYPAATWPHKDHATLLRSFAALRRGGRGAGQLGESLVLTGAKTREWPGLRRLAAELGVSEEVRHLGFRPRADLERLYANASAVVFPSRYEGFGLPILEAAARGCRVIARPLPVYAELGVPAEAQIDFGDPDALAAALARPGRTVLTRPPPTWDGCVSGTLAALRRAASNRS